MSSRPGKQRNGPLTNNDVSYAEGFNTAGMLASVAYDEFPANKPRGRSSGRRKVPSYSPTRRRRSKRKSRKAWRSMLLGYLKVVITIFAKFGAMLISPFAWFMSRVFPTPAETQRRRTTERYLAVLNSTESFQTYFSTAQLLDAHLGLAQWQLEAPSPAICNAHGLLFDAHVAVELARSGNDDAMACYLRNVLMRNAHGMTDGNLYPYLTGTKACVEDYCQAVIFLIRAFGGQAQQRRKMTKPIIRPCFMPRDAAGRRTHASPGSSKPDTASDTHASSADLVEEVVAVLECNMRAKSGEISPNCHKSSYIRQVSGLQGIDEDQGGEIDDGRMHSAAALSTNPSSYALVENRSHPPSSYDLRGNAVFLGNAVSSYEMEILSSATATTATHINHGRDDAAPAALAAVSAAVASSCPQEFPIPVKLSVLRNTLRTYGRTALVLSGGASMGTYHTGVVRALFEANVLPGIMSGSSAGSIIAALVCTKAPKDLRRFIKDEVLSAKALNLSPFGSDCGMMEKVKRFFQTGFLMDVRSLMECLRDHCGDMTFAEAYKLSGRVLNISVTKDKHEGSHFDRHVLLNYLTAPHVVIWSAVSASCALPGLFNAVQLIEKAPDSGTFRPYLPGDLFCDGSVAQDIPRDRLAQLFNANYFIVSQVNPYVIPFLRPGGASVATQAAADRSPLAASHAGITDLTSSSWLGTAWYTAATMARYALLKCFHSGLLPKTGALQIPYLLLTQSYRGNVTILPIGELYNAVPDYLNMINNPTAEYISFVCARAQVRTWPLISCIRSTTCIERALVDEIALLEQSLSS